ncbi:tetratricopeptide repeat domain protein, partial [Aspergillus steynii IBT 23096]
MACPTKLEDCTVVWLCPREVDLRAAIAMLDRASDKIPARARGQNVIYTVGEISCHKVAVVGYYQEQGLAVSGSMAAEVTRDLPNLQFGFLVGIAGGIPSPTRNIQLGDVAVAVPEKDRPGVVGYDLGVAGEDDRFDLKHWQNSTHPLLRSMINIVRARNESRFWRHLCSDNLTEFRRPDGRLVQPKVHYGTILSGNSDIQSKTRRDYLRDRYGGIAVEMEAAGMMTRLPVAVIRGISDFADGVKNDAWQAHAAITAAAYTKELLVRLPGEKKENSPTNCMPEVSQPTPFADQDIRLTQALPEGWAFVGREGEMAFLEKELGFSAQPLLQRCVAGLWGLTGVGKSQLAARFVSQQRSKHPEREIFWISGESQEAFEHSVISMLKVGVHGYASDHANFIELSQEQRTALVNSFFAELNRMDDARWLLVIDGLNANPWRNSSHTASVDIHIFVGRLKRGYVLLTSRRRDLVERYHPNREVKGLSDEDAVALLRTQVDPRLIGRGGLFLPQCYVREKVGLLKGLPLALRLAASNISRYRYTVTDCLEAWTYRGTDSGFLGIDETLSRSMELSFKELELADPVAARILTLFSFLHHRDLWYDLCLGATEDTYPAWLHELAAQNRPFRDFYPLLADLSFIELRFAANGHQLWETHPAIQVVARQRAICNGQDHVYIRCAISLVASYAPRSYEEDFWDTIRRLEPHADLCWSYITQGKWGPDTNLTELESLGSLFRHVGQYGRAEIIYRMVENGLTSLIFQTPSLAAKEFLADVQTNLGLVYTCQRKFDPALRAFEQSLALKRETGGLEPDEAMSIMYNKAVVFMMTDKLEEAEALLCNAAAHFAQSETESLLRKEYNHLCVRIIKDMGELILRRGLTEAAMSLFRDVFDTQRNVLGDTHPTLVSLKLNMGRASTELGQFEAARALLEEVIAIYTEWWGRRHPETMRAIDELAWTLMEEGRYKEAVKGSALSEMQKAGELWEEVLGFYRSIHGDGSDMAGQVSLNLLCLGNAGSADQEMNGGYIPVLNL